MSLWNLDFQTVEWLFPMAALLHNAEEAIWLPGWSKRAVLWHSPVTPGSFRFAVAVLTLLAFAITWLSAASGKQTVWTYLAFGYMAAMLANVLIPHIALTVALRSYMPGVATAVAFNLPVLSLLGMLAIREGYVSGWKAVGFCVGVAGALVASIFALFKLGKVLNL
jgi:hypothetical protein